MDLSCTQCTDIAASSALFCENCGTELPGAASQPQQANPLGPEHVATTVNAVSAGCACGGNFAADGYCDHCGAVRRPPRDHLVEQPQPWLASVSDRGLRHHRNEDAAAVAVVPAPGSSGHAVLVVCDGVSSADYPDEASLAAARAARDYLTQALPAAAEPSDAVLTELIAAATDEASVAARACRPNARDNPPSCTYVAGIALANGRFYVGCVGDSRGYWVPDLGPAKQLSVDDSVAEELISRGMSREAAEAGPQGHTITRWLGRDAPDHSPRLSAGTAPSPGWLVLCSDGLWNYCSAAADFGRVFAAVAGIESDPLLIAEALVAWANEQGGRDNITVALARITPQELPDQTRSEGEGHGKV